MRNPSRLLTAATLLLLIGATSAAPPPPPPLTSSALEARGPEATEASEAWVTVDSSGVPATVTPVVTADGDGAATTISNAVPEELTATVFTRTEYAEVTTSTAGPAGPVPTATGEDGSGSFLACDNADGPYFPFCQPAQNSSLYPGTTYYVTWDPSVFASSNTTVIVEGVYVNATSGEITSQAFTSPKTEAGRSYYPWPVDTSLLGGADHDEAVNITLVIRALAPDSNATAEVYAGPTVAVVAAADRRSPSSALHDGGGAAPGLPTGAALYIGIPTVLGFCALMLCGVCTWNREARRIGLGNVMSRRRGRRGGGGGRRASRRDRKSAVRLADHDGGDVVVGGEVKGAKRDTRQYRDEEFPPRIESVRYEDDGWVQDWESQEDEDEVEEVEVEKGYRFKDRVVHVGVARRDSDALGSLAGTPTSEHFPSTERYGRR